MVKISGPERVSGLLGITLLSLIVGASGSLTHIFFYHDIDERILFENAWDETFYALVMSGRLEGWNEYPLRSIAAAMQHVIGDGSYWSALISDTIWPMMATLAAGVLSLKFFRSAFWSVLATFFLLFGGDILGFNSSVIHDPAITLSYFLRDIPSYARQLISDPYVSFLYIYRTPEPQLSLPIFFLLLVTIATYFRSSSFSGLRCFYVSLALFLTSLSYTFFAVAGIVVGLAATLSMLLTRRWQLSLGLATPCGIIGASLVYRVFTTHSGEANATVFYSTLPMVSLGVVYGLFLASLLLYFRRSRLMDDPSTLLAFMCFLIPAALMNQQTLSGIMVQTLNWERYVNFPILTFGTFLILQKIDFERLKRHARDRLKSISPLWGSSHFVNREWARRLPWSGNQTLAGKLRSGLPTIVALLFSSLFLYYVQLTNYRQFFRYNVETIAASKLIDTIHNDMDSVPTKIILENMASDAPVIARLSTTNVEIDGYTKLIKTLFQSTEDSGLASRLGFDYASRLGLSPQEYGDQLENEINLGVCWPHLMFQEHFLNCAPYVSDFRRYDQAALKARIPELISNYQAYLDHAFPPEPALLIVAKSYKFGEQTDKWRASLVGEMDMTTHPNGFAPQERVIYHAYLQEAASNK